ncbi:hypothetical protein AJ79_08016 [Helicocarpus griseus UAMH5409]|uniref:CFEM domain-containing protein n=1 Tax=Helicocarpus griseus UAMH5409 TaxID=1447875 RepID=A0A2B7WWS3_9EURO|nr:hypothetical protein AJ79_08016 [Helicocarpus griseus UAMH5409]
MRLTVAALSSLLALVAAQGLGGLPPCAQKCATPAIPKECGLKVECICTAQSFLEAITCCVAENCGKEDQEKTIQFAKGICGTAGAGDNIPDQAVCKTGSPSSSGPTSSKADTATDTGRMTGTAIRSSSATDSASATATESVTETQAPTSGTEPTATQTGGAGGQETGTPTPTTGAAAKAGSMGLGMVGLVFGAMGLF